ncbi:MAG: M16 family metallopeptidase [Candidatus Dojkabacteria bacterium]
MSDSLNLDYKKIILPNGTKCILYQRNEIHSINISIEVQTGSLDEDRKTSGISHLLEHVTFDGTRDFKDWEELDRFRNSISGNTNASTNYEETTYYGTFPSKYFDEALYYLSQVSLHPTITEESITKERTIVLDEMKRYEDSVDHQVYRNIIENRFTNNENTYAYDIIGFTDTLNSFKSKDLTKYFQERYTPDNMEIYIVGNFDFEKLEASLKKYFYEDIKDRATKKPERKFKKDFPDYSGFKVHTKQKLDLDQYYLTMTFPGTDFASTDTIKRILMDYVEDVTATSQYFQSVLWKKLREELGLVYGVSAWTGGMYNRAYAVIETSFKPEHLEVILTEIYKGINTVKNNEVNDEVFKLKQKRNIDNQPMRLDSPMAALNWVNYIEDEKEEHNFDLNLEKYLQINSDFQYKQAVELANEIYDWSKVNIGIVSKDDPKEVENKLTELWQKITKK